MVGRKIFGYAIVTLGWGIMRMVYDPPMWSAETAVLLAGVAAICTGMAIVDAARAGVWPWER